MFRIIAKVPDEQKDVYDIPDSFPSIVCANESAIHLITFDLVDDVPMYKVGVLVGERGMYYTFPESIATEWTKRQVGRDT